MFLRSLITNEILDLRRLKLHNLVLSCLNVHCVQVFAKKKHTFTALRPERDIPHTMKINSPQFSAIFTPELTSLAALFLQYGHEIRIAGGAVRDLLVDIQPHDLDFATTATPEQMKEMFTKEEVRMINTKGEKHGTITPRINDRQNFEVTTLRIDVVTDGRHADVEFTKDWQLDANRRDLTINSMFLDLDGTVYDYFNGYEDLLNQRIVFVGDPTSRIQEDYLRILRYFRFHGRIAKDPTRHNKQTLQAIQDNVAGLTKISGERIWSELHKILAGNNAGELINTMLKLGIGPQIGLPSEPDMDTFDAVWERGRHLNLHPMTLLCGMFRNQEDVMNFNARVKLSSYERELGLFVVQHRENKVAINKLKPYQVLVLQTSGKGKLSDVQDWVVEVLKYRGEADYAEQFKAWEIPKFPVSGNILREKGVPGGKLMGPVMKKLREYWAEHDFNLSTEEILEELPHILASLDIPVPKGNQQ